MFDPELLRTRAELMPLLEMIDDAYERITDNDHGPIQVHSWSSEGVLAEFHANLSFIPRLAEERIKAVWVDAYWDMVGNSEEVLFRWTSEFVMDGLLPSAARQKARNRSWKLRWLAVQALHGVTWEEVT